MRTMLSFFAVLFLCVLCGCSGSSSPSNSSPSAPAATLSALTVNPNPAISGAAVTLSVAVTSASGTPTGSVAYFDGSTSLGTATLAAGSATLSTTSLSSGTHTLTAQYAGTSTFAASNSAAVTEQVNAPAPAATTTMLSVSPNPAAAGATVTLIATVGSSASTPSGIVTFLDGSTTLGTGTLASGVATYTTTSLSAGTTHTLTASYAASSSYAGSVSAAVSLTVTAAFTANASLSFTTPHQTITGFGASEAFYTNYLDMHPNESQIVKALYDPTAGLGMTILRLQNNYNNYNGTNATTFDPDNTKLVTAVTATLGAKPTVFMSSWTPPASLKSNNSLNGCTTNTNGNCTAGFGTLAQVNGAYNYSGFGQYWLSSLQAYAAMGVVPDFISIQNEPDFPSSYVGCLFNPTEAPAKLYTSTQSYASYGQAFDATYKALHAAGALVSVPQMIGPEPFSLYNVQALLTEAPASEMYGVAHHLYNVSSYGGNPAGQITPMQTLANVYPTTPKFETEYFQTPGFSNAVDIHNALTQANDSVYLYWAAAWPSALANGISTDQEGLLYIDNPFTPSSWAFSNGWTYNDSYYTLKHYSYFVRPGYIRYNATSDNANEDISVFQSPDKSKTVVVVLNTSSSATDTFGLNLAGVTYSTSAVYRSSFATPITTTGAERWNPLGSYTSPGISLPPQSAVTLVFTK